MKNQVLILLVLFVFAVIPINVSAMIMPDDNGEGYVIEPDEGMFVITAIDDYEDVSDDAEVRITSENDFRDISDDAEVRITSENDEVTTTNAESVSITSADSNKQSYIVIIGGVSVFGIGFLMYNLKLKKQES